MRGYSRRGILAAGLAMAATPALAASDGFDRFARDQIEKGAIPGLAVGLAKDGKVVFAKGYGLADIARRQPVSDRTVFHIASITKTITAAAIMRLVEAGKLGLDEPVAPRLDFPLANPRHPDAPITVRQLLTHTSSISDARYYEIDFREPGHDAKRQLGDLLKSYLAPGGAHYSPEACFLAGAPGSTWDYSNIGYGLLGYLAGRVGGEDMREQITRHVFKPLGMDAARWTIEGPGQSATPYDVVDGKLTPAAHMGMPDWPAGAVRASVLDMTRYVAACADGGGAMLSQTDMARLLEMHTPAGLPEWLTGQGLGWQASLLDGVARPNHWGGDPGVFTAAYLNPAARTGVAILTNTSITPAARDAVKAIAARLLT